MKAVDESSPFRPSCTAAENRLTLGQYRRSHTIQVPIVKPEAASNKENTTQVTAKRLSKATSGAADPALSQRCFTFSREELEKAGGEKTSALNDLDDIQKVVEETKERENRIKKQLAMLREQALAAVAEPEKSPENQDLSEQLNKYQTELTCVKDTMENILHYTKQTHNEVQKTKDLVSSIHEMTPNKCGSFQFDENEDQETGGVVKYSVVEKPGSDEEGISNIFFASL